MSVDDIIYIFLLLGCIGFGYFYRRLDKSNVSRKRWIGSAVGLSLIVIVSGLHTAHILITFSVSALIIRMTSVR